MKVPPQMLLPRDWGMLFMRFLKRKQAIKGRYREISVEELTRFARIFAMAMKYKFPKATITEQDVLDVVIGEGWVIPSAGSTFTLSD